MRAHFTLLPSAALLAMAGASSVMGYVIPPSSTSSPTSSSSNSVPYVAGFQPGHSLGNCPLIAPASDVIASITLSDPSSTVADCASACKSRTAMNKSNALRFHRSTYDTCNYVVGSQLYSAGKYAGVVCTFYTTDESQDESNKRLCGYGFKVSNVRNTMSWLVEGYSGPNSEYASWSEQDAGYTAI